MPFTNEKGPKGATNGLPLPATSPRARMFKMSVGPDGGPPLLPSRNPPSFSIFDIFPFTMLVKPLTKRGVKLSGKTAAKARAKMGYGRNDRDDVISHNIPLEVSLYLVCDVPTINLLLNSLNAMVDALTGLERILTTPIPFSYSIHLWTVTLLYCAALPFQLVKTMSWLTIPATAIATFVFTGFVVAGEEIEDPFGFDRNDLNLDHFTANIIRVELASITSVPVPDPAKWAFVPENDHLFTRDMPYGQAPTPEDWVKKGVMEMRMQLARGLSHDATENPAPKPHKNRKGDLGGHQESAPVASSAGAVGAAGAAGGAAGDSAAGGGIGGE
ncbi:5520_t:CDS:2 [Acaulospora colombiana]|uniref:5520_t:CDS:1 n=1 Tax=Acaulospora colombiana TaxID=27376 RepID=A0ACA9L6P0_9GLOM|nr:5520_t:CDS:2 [Acaulospora colombiana]